MEDSSVHHANMVWYVVTGLQEALQQDQSPTENKTTVQEPIDHVANVVQITQKQLATQLQQMQEMMQAIQIQYSAAP